MIQKRPAIFARSVARATLLALTGALVGCAGLQPSDSEVSLARSSGYRGGEVVAVLLPESGRYANAAKVVRNGILAAQRADKQGKRPQLRFYDTSDGKSTPALIKRAAGEGASLAIGPLQKKAVNGLASSSSLPIPTLALNRATTDKAPSKNLYQFALSPEDEAADAATKAWKEGLRSALLLYPDGSWGNRISRGFRQKWRALGGKVVASQVYDPGELDFSQPVGNLLNSKRDADFVFLVATPRSAPAIWPQLKYQAGSALPVYATSHVYSAGSNRKADQELAGLYFVDIPWLVAPEKGDSVSRKKDDQGKYPRLYAMGIDAYRLAPRLEWMAARQASVQGKTGRLTLDSRRRVRRQLNLARLSAGGPVLAMTGARPGEPLIVGAGLPRAMAPLLAAVGYPSAVTARP